MAGASDAKKAVGDVIGLVMIVVFGALIIGTVLGNTVFSTLTIINTSKISTDFGSMVTGILGFLGIIGTTLGIVWLATYVKKLFDKKTGLTNLAA